MTWDEYYEKFYDWAESTQVSRISAITEFGDTDEICEVADAFFDEKPARRLINKALKAGVRFMPEQIMELSVIMDKNTLSKLVDTSAVPLSREQLEELYMLIDDEIFQKASERAGIDIFEPDDDYGCNYDTEPQQVLGKTDKKRKKTGILASILLGMKMADRSKKGSGHDGKCSGDCSNCPAHYGYRYGRWYYGHHHTEGCEFGGNGSL